MDEVKGSCARVASRRLLPEHRYSTPNEPPAGLCSGSWCQVGWAASTTPPLHCLDSVQVAVRALAAAREMREITVELIESFPPLRIEGQHDHRALGVGPFPTFDW
jgi:hypothetical protein